MAGLVRRTVPPQPIAAKLAHMDWLLPLLAAAIALVGIGALYSTAGGSLEPWAGRHAARVCAGLLLLLIVGLMPPRIWLRSAYPIYAVVGLLLVAVPLAGHAQLGARRWIGTGEVSLQPAEIMKVALLLALARYYQWLPSVRRSRPLWVAIPALMIALPALLVLKQPDLGTAVLIAAAGTAVMVLAGVGPLYFAAGLAAVGGLGQAVWPYLKDYQRRRLLTFLHPEQDPLGAGYHIAQSKIALGAGGLHGRGFLGGTQSQLNFLPEKHTDFIFTMLAEETGFAGAMTLIGLYAALLAVLVMIAYRAPSVFGRLLAGGIAALFALHVSVNIGMVTGLLPVVGVPLPLVSYGGTSLMTLMFGLGLALSITVHRREPLRRDETPSLW